MSTEKLRELDAWIATHLFGWVRTDVKCDATDNRTIGGFLYSPYGLNDDLSQASFPPRYTTDPSAAFEVLKACLSSDRLPTEIQIDRKRTKEGRFRIEAGTMSNCILSIEDTLELAICQFARQLYGK
jgi:hypothetical protein